MILSNTASRSTHDKLSQNSSSITSEEVTESSSSVYSLKKAKFELINATLEALEEFPIMLKKLYCSKKYLEVKVKKVMSVVFVNL